MISKTVVKLLEERGFRKTIWKTSGRLHWDNGILDVECLPDNWWRFWINGGAAPPMTGRQVCLFFRRLNNRENRRKESKETE